MIAGTYKTTWQTFNRVRLPPFELTGNNTLEPSGCECNALPHPSPHAASFLASIPHFALQPKKCWMQIPHRANYKNYKMTHYWYVRSFKNFPRVGNKIFYCSSNHTLRSHSQSHSQIVLGDYKTIKATWADVTCRSGHRPNKK